MSERQGRVFHQALDIHLCRECSSVATRQFAEDFPDAGRTIFRGFYCDDHAYRGEQDQ